MTGTSGTQKCALELISISPEVRDSGGLFIGIHATKSPDFVLKQARLRIIGEDFWKEIGKIIGKNILATFRLTVHPIVLCPDLLNPKDFRKGSTEVTTGIILGARYQKSSIEKRIKLVIQRGDPPLIMQVHYGQRTFGWREEGLLFSFQTRMSDILRASETKKPLEMKPELLKSNPLTSSQENNSEPEILQVSEEEIKKTFETISKAFPSLDPTLLQGRERRNTLREKAKIERIEITRRQTIGETKKEGEGEEEEGDGDEWLLNQLIQSAASIDIASIPGSDDYRAERRRTLLFVKLDEELETKLKKVPQINMTPYGRSSFLIMNKSSQKTKPQMNPALLEQLELFRKQMEETDREQERLEQERLETEKQEKERHKLKKEQEEAHERERQRLRKEEEEKRLEEEEKQRKKLEEDLKTLEEKLREQEEKMAKPKKSSQINLLGTNELNKSGEGKKDSLKESLSFRRGSQSNSTHGSNNEEISDKNRKNLFAEEASDDLPNLEGFLEKKGDVGVIKTWKRRFFVLRGSRALYWASEQQKQQGLSALGYIPLSRATTIEVTPKLLAGFQITTEEPHRIWYLKADTIPEMHNWMNAIIVHSRFGME